MKCNTIYDCSIIELPQIKDRAGNITTVQHLDDIPFEIKRIFYLYDIPGGANRGAHSHKECHQFIIAASGSFEVFLDDGNIKKTVVLNIPNRGIHIPPGIWASEINFSSGAICLVMASHFFTEDDYIRNYKTFLKYKNLKYVDRD